MGKRTNGIIHTGFDDTKRTESKQAIIKRCQEIQQVCRGVVEDIPGRVVLPVYIKKPQRS